MGGFTPFLLLALPMLMVRSLCLGDGCHGLSLLQSVNGDKSGQGHACWRGAVRGQRRVPFCSKLRCRRRCPGAACPAHTQLSKRSGIEQALAAWRGGQPGASPPRSRSTGRSSGWVGWRRDGAFAKCPPRAACPCPCASLPWLGCSWWHGQGF